jgi:hypothetical protein
MSGWREMAGEERSDARPQNRRNPVVNAVAVPVRVTREAALPAEALQMQAKRRGAGSRSL